MVLNNIFSGSINHLKKGMDASSLRGQVIQNNIANAETPGYKRQSVLFEDLYQQAVLDQDAFAVKKTRSKHIDFGDSGLEAQVVTHTDSTMRMDDNNVDVEYENAELAKNQIYFSTLTEKLNSELRRLRMAIREGS